MNPPNVYEVTSPKSHSTSKITKIAQSLVFSLRNRFELLSPCSTSLSILYPLVSDDLRHMRECWSETHVYKTRHILTGLPFGYLPENARVKVPI